MIRVSSLLEVKENAIESCQIQWRDDSVSEWFQALFDW